VWNRHAEKARGQRRRPRSEWLVRRDTHPALITEEEAEIIIARLTAGRRPRYQTASPYLLSGLLEDSKGRAWHGKGGGFYGLGTRSIAAHRVEGAVLSKLAEDLRSETFTRLLVRQAQATLRSQDESGELARLTMERAEVDKRIGRLTALLSETATPAPLVRQIEKFEAQRVAIEERIAVAKRRTEQARAVKLITPEHVRRLLDDMAVGLEALPRAEIKTFVAGLVARVIFDPGESRCCIHYRIPLEAGDLVASPRGFVQIPRGRAA